MNKVETVYQPGVIGTIEQFTLAEEELRQYVIYTYYNKAGEALYVGCSKAFYDAHYFNRDRLPFFSKVEYVGFVFMDNEADMKDARKYFIKAREPKHNQRKCKDTPLLPGLDPSADHLVVSNQEMMQRWYEFLSPEPWDPEVEAEKQLIRDTVAKLRALEDPEGLFDTAASLILNLSDRLAVSNALLDLDELT